MRPQTLEEGPRMLAGERTLRHAFASIALTKGAFRFNFGQNACQCVQTEASSSMVRA